MVNMSYCRFENTGLALNECLDALDSYESELSRSEMKKGVRMFEHFLHFCYNEGIIEGFDEDRIREMFQERQDAQDDFD